MRLRTFSIALGSLLAIGVLGACNGGDDGTPTAGSTAVADNTPAPTATALAQVPDPIIVTGGGLPGGGGTEEAAEYVVEAGDSLGAISSRFGVDADLIREANDIEGDEIFVGQTLLIPRGGSAPSTSSTATATPTPPADNGGDDDDETPGGGLSEDGTTYTVQEGDTAFGIALEFDTTVEALAAANGMTEDEITDLQIGQEIQLPTPQ